MQPREQIAQPCASANDRPTAAFVAALKKATLHYVADETKNALIANFTYDLVMIQGCKIPAYRKDDIGVIDRMFNRFESNKRLAEHISLHLMNIRGGSWGCLSELLGDDNGRQRYRDRLTAVLREFCPELYIGVPITPATASASQSVTSSGSVNQQAQFNQLMEEMNKLKEQLKACNNKLADCDKQLADHKEQIKDYALQLSQEKQTNERLRAKLKMTMSNRNAPAPNSQDAKDNVPTQANQAHFVPPSSPCPAYSG